MVEIDAYMEAAYLPENLDFSLALEKALHTAGPDDETIPGSPSPLKSTKLTFDEATDPPENSENKRVSEASWINTFLIRGMHATRTHCQRYLNDVNWYFLLCSWSIHWLDSYIWWPFMSPQQVYYVNTYHI